MTAAYGLDWFRQMLWTAVIAAGPVVLSIVAIGLVIAIVQAATQVNDQAVAFAPKAIVAVIALVVSGPWIMSHISEFMIELFAAMGNLRG